MIKIKYDYTSGLVFVEGLNKYTLPNVYMEEYKVEHYPYVHGISHSFDFGLPGSANILIVGDGCCYLRRDIVKKILDITKQALLHWELEYEIIVEPKRAVIFEKGKAKKCV